MTAKDKGGKYMEQMKNRKEHEATEKFANVLLMSLGPSGQTRMESV